jgi:hypothetical protein
VPPPLTLCPPPALVQPWWWTGLLFIHSFIHSFIYLFIFISPSAPLGFEKQEEEEEVVEVEEDELPLQLTTAGVEAFLFERLPQRASRFRQRDNFLVVTSRPLRSPRGTRPRPVVHVFPHVLNWQCSHTDTGVHHHSYASPARRERAKCSHRLWDGAVRETLVADPCAPAKQTTATSTTTMTTTTTMTILPFPIPRSPRAASSNPSRGYSAAAP